jgi:hypothetical protein
MAKIIPLPTQVWDFLEGVIIYTVYAIAAIALARYGPDHLQTLLFANLPGLSILALSVLRKTIENRR